MFNFSNNTMLIYAVIVLSILGIISAILNIFLLIVFIKAFSSLKKLPYFYFSAQILACNLTGLVVKFAYVIPNAAMDNNESKMPEPYVAAMALVETVVYHGELFFILALAFYRLLVFFSFKFIQHPGFCAAQILFWWLCVGLFVIGQCVFECFDTSISPNSIENGVWDGVRFYAYCDTSTTPKLIFKYIIVICNDYLPAITLVFYLLIIIKIRFHLNFKTGKITPILQPACKKRQQQDLVIFLQAFTTYACFFTKFRILNTIGYGDSESSLSIFLRCFIYVSVYVRDTTQAVFFLGFNQVVRKHAKEILFGQKNDQKVIFINHRSISRSAPPRGKLYVHQKSPLAMRRKTAF